MRKLFTLLTLCLLASAAWAGDVEFVAGVDNGNSPGERAPYTIEKEGVKIEVSDGLANTNQYRMYKGSTTTISSTAGAITKIVFECTANDDAQYGPGCFTATPGDYSYSGKIGTWTGSAESIVFTAATNQVRATKITVTTSASGLAAPAFSPKAGTYYEPFKVTITCASQGAKIYYTTDGNDPTTASTQYTAPIQVNGDMTIKAISALNGKTSEVATAKYVITTPVVVNSIAEFQALADNTAAKFANPVYALAQNKGYLYVKDNTGYALFYGDCGQSYVNGDKIPAGFCGTKTTYAGEPEFQWLEGFKAAEGNTPIAPVELPADQVGHGTFGQYVVMYGVTITLNEDGKNYTLTDKNGKTCAVYFGNMGASVPTNLSGSYNVKGIVGSYGNTNTIYQLLPTEVTPVFDHPVGLGDLGDLPDDTETAVILTYEATVLGQSGSYLYLMDETGYGLVYGSCGKTYKQGDVIPGGYSGIKKTYDMEPELTFVKDGIQLSGFGNSIRNIGEPEPEAIATLKEVNHDNWGKYIKIKVKVNTGNQTFEDEQGNTIGYYDRFGCAFPTDGDFHEVHAIVGSYKTNYQLLPVKFKIDIVPVLVSSIYELYALPEGGYGEFTTPLTAVYQCPTKPYLYVQDATGKVSLVYGSVPEQFVNGDIIKKGATATWSLYPKTNGYQQMVPLEGTFVKDGHGAAVKPITITIEDISQNNVHGYLRLEEMTITPTDDPKKFNMVDVDDEKILLFNQFVMELPEFDPNTTYDVEGFLSIYNGEREIFVNKVEKHGQGDWLKGDVNGDGSVNITDINVLISIILGANMDDATMKRADVNEDGSINISDINEVIAIILK